MEDRDSLHGQCFGVWKQQVKDEMEHSGASQHDILTLDWDYMRESYYNMGISPHDTIAEEMTAL